MGGGRKRAHFGKVGVTKEVRNPSHSDFGRIRIVFCGDYYARRGIKWALVNARGLFLLREFAVLGLADGASGTVLERLMGQTNDRLAAVVSAAGTNSSRTRIDSKLNKCS